MTDTLNNNDTLKKPEPLLVGELRQTSFPIEMFDFDELYNKAVKNFWHPNEFDVGFQNDMTEWRNLENDNINTIDILLEEGKLIKEMVKNIIIAFARGDAVPVSNSFTNYVPFIKRRDILYFVNYMIMIEDIHAKTYGKMYTLYVGMDKIDILKSPLPHDEIFDWVKKYIDSGSFTHSVFALVLFEGLVFPQLFAPIFWLKNRNKLPGFTKANDQIFIDELTHVDFSILLYSYIVNKLTEQEAIKIVSDLVDILDKFVEKIIPNLNGLNPQLMSKYIRYIADNLLIRCGYNRKWNVPSPFRFMDSALNNKPKRSNNFEIKSVEYEKSSANFNISFDIPD